MYLRLSEEQKMVQETIRKFVEKELYHLENEVLRRSIEGKPDLPEGKLEELQEKAKQAGFWGINTPAEYGGADLRPSYASDCYNGNFKNICSIPLRWFCRQYFILCQ